MGRLENFSCESEGCTCFWDVIFGYDITECCNRHDSDYDVDTNKFQDDWRLLVCVWNKSWKLKPIAVMMYLGVSTVGWLWWFKDKLKNHQGWQNWLRSIY